METAAFDAELGSRRLVGLFAKTRQSFKPIHRPASPLSALPLDAFRRQSCRLLETGHQPRWLERQIREDGPRPHGGRLVFKDQFTDEVRTVSQTDRDWFLSLNTKLIIGSVQLESGTQRTVDSEFIGAVG